MLKTINDEVSTVSISTANELIDRIQNRELYISNIRVEMIKQWSLQGQELQQLQIEHQCTQNALTKLTGISKASVYNYISISKDPRILKLLDKGDHRGGQLECFNQKQLVKLTKLDDGEFEASVATGALVLVDQTAVVGTAVVPAIEKKKESEKAVIQINTDGKEIARYPSASMDQFITGVNRMSIGKICRGEAGRSHAGGCRWEFA